MNFLGRLLAGGHSADDEAGAVSRVAADEDVGGVLWVLWLQEAHSQQAEFSLDDFGFPFLDHDGTSAVGVGFPIDFLHLDACQLALLAQKFEGVDVPAACAAFFVRRGGLEGARIVRPGVLRIYGSLDGLGHNLYLGDALAALTVGGADAVGACVAATDDEYVLSLGGDALFLRELDACEYAVLLGEEFEGEVNAPQFATRSLQIAGGGGAGGEDDGIWFF